MELCTGYLKVAKRADHKSPPHKEKKKKNCNYSQLWMLTRLTVVIISECRQILNCYAVHLKLTYANYISIKNIRRKIEAQKQKIIF